MRPDHFDTGAGDYIGDRLDYNHREMVIDSTYVSPFAVTMKGQQAEEYDPPSPRSHSPKLPPPDDHRDGPEQTKTSSELVEQDSGSSPSSLSNMTRTLAQSQSSLASELAPDHPFLAANSQQGYGSHVRASTSPSSTPPVSAPLGTSHPLRPKTSTSSLHQNQSGYAFPGSMNGGSLGGGEGFGMSPRTASNIPMPTTTSTAGSGNAPTVNAAQHRISISARPRRPSPLLHEIQPPSRRLSAHQVLLLTPFGEPLPGGTPPLPNLSRGSFSRTSMGEAGGMGMTRIPSSQGGSGMARTPTLAGWHGGANRRTSQGMSFGPTAMGPRGSIGGSVGMDIGPTAMGREVGGEAGTTMSRQEGWRAPPIRGRHQSLANPSVHPSPLSLSSAPMATITSASEHSSSDGPGSTLPSREHTNQPPPQEEDMRPMEHVGFVPPVVPMTRSNSLPVLTLRELEALKEKDGELGIARGSNWAWVSREGVDDESVTESVEDLADTTASTSSTSLSGISTSSSNPPHHPFFNDPFASTSNSSSASASMGISPSTNFHPTSTASDYRYSDINELRRMSAAPVNPSHSPTAASRLDARRPSAPAFQIPPSLAAPVQIHPTSTQLHSAPSSQHQESRRGSGSSRATPRSSTNQLLAPLPPESPGGTPLSSPTRPRILRYKTSPARFVGLGLEITVRPNPAPAPAPPVPSVSTSTGTSTWSGPGERRRSSNESVGSRGSSQARGTWASYDVVDALSASIIPRTAAIPATIGPASSRSTNTPLTASSGSSSLPSRRGSRQIPGVREVFTLETIVPRSHVSEFGLRQSPIRVQRSRIESMDSALPLYAADRRTSGTTAGASWGESFPRRGSLAILDLPAQLAASLGIDPFTGDGAAAGMGHGTVLPALETPAVLLGAPSGNWQQRRGSWAEHM